jgi:2-phosphoglycerate kinase
MTRDKTPHITISDQGTGLPYSKGLMAFEVMVSGLSTYRAYEVAETIENRLLDEGRLSITTDELSATALAVIDELSGARYATTFARWQHVRRLDVPLLILIGGAVGVGKSTIARRLAHRLEMGWIATDGTIREVMRAMLSAELMPALHESSFQTDQAVREPTRPSDALVAGFREQTHAVSVGVDAMIRRSITEGTSTVIEGVHVVPGFFDLASYGESLVAVPLVLAIDDEERHLNHFAARESAGVRPAERYARNFENIRKLQRYVKSQALSHGVPIIENHNFDQAISAVLDLVMERATAWAERHTLPAEGEEGKTA